LDRPAPRLLPWLGFGGRHCAGRSVSPFVGGLILSQPCRVL
jgi:hypothetical protein